MNKGRLFSAYYDFSLKVYNPLWLKGKPADKVMLAGFKLDADISEIAPYINAVAQKAAYYGKPPFIKFLLDGFGCTLYRNRGSAAALSDRDQALNFMETLLAFLNNTHLSRDSIEPTPKRYRPISVLDVFRLLSGTNCRTCGFATCMAFAAAISRRKTAPRRCPGFCSPISLAANFSSGSRVVFTTHPFYP